MRHQGGREYDRFSDLLAPKVEEAVASV